MLTQLQSTQSRNIACARKNWEAVEQHLTRFEKVHGFAEAWELRERIEKGDVTLRELMLRR